MAEENKTEDGVNEDVNADAAGSTEASEATNTESEQAAATEPSETEQKLQEQFSELQGKFDTLSQDSARNQQYLNEIWPYVDMDKYKEGRQGGEAGVDGEADGSFLTQKEAKALESRIDAKIKTAEFQTNFRTKYPDVGDKGPKEEMVRYFFENKTLRTDSFDKRLESAVKATRELLKVGQDKAIAEAKAKDEKAEAETKAKAEAAAEASGLDSGSITSPQAADKDETETSPSDYLAQRKTQQEKLKTL